MCDLIRVKDYANNNERKQDLIAVKWSSKYPNGASLHSLQCGRSLTNSAACCILLHAAVAHVS
jgi:hypothetical protein